MKRIVWVLFILDAFLTARVIGDSFPPAGASTRQQQKFISDAL